MNGGLRLQLLALLGGLLLLLYVPLFFATSTYIEVGLQQLQRDNAEKLGRSVTAHLAELRPAGDDERWLELARAQIEGGSVHALAMVGTNGKAWAVLGDEELLGTVADRTRWPTPLSSEPLQTRRGPALLVFAPAPPGGIAAAIRVDPEVTRAVPLSRLMGLYMVVSGIALLAVAYLALTRWIVRPIVTLEQGAERVASGNLRLKPIERAPRELANLSRQLSHMTERLAQEERSLHQKIQELEALAKELKDTQASLVRSERLATVGRLAAGLAHEVGNPISALMGLQDLMQDEELSPEERQDFLSRMRKETSRIDRVLSDLLAYARSSGTAAKKRPPEPGSIPDALEDVRGLLAPQSSMKEIELLCQTEAELPLVPLAPAELTQVLLNLVMNAIDACSGRGRIEVVARRSGDNQVELVVDDDGPGIADEAREQIFEPFVSTKEVGKGTGLGLAVTRGLVEGAGGRVFASASPQGGARFSVVLPSLTASLPPEPSS